MALGGNRSHNLDPGCCRVKDPDIALGRRLGPDVIIAPGDITGDSLSHFLNSLESHAVYDS